jgi:hypothetical protein
MDRVFSVGDADGVELPATTLCGRCGRSEEEIE